ncbi:lipid A deacylase LpxR family protein [Rickettsiales bacterium]|nr:lipid A deacylase LpxR family protein [Rickettsiales bacterium]
MKRSLLTAIVTISVILPQYSFATKNIDNKGTFAISFENDLFAGDDSGYTNGVRISWLSDEEEAPVWMENLANMMPLFANEGRQRYSFAFGQSIFSPKSLHRRDLIGNDRPYAGFLYGSAGMLRDTGEELDNLVLTLGIVGPSALGEEAQNTAHRLNNYSEAQGWANQLKDEPGIMLTYEKKWRNIYEFSPFGWAVDATPHMGGSIGNVYTYASTGAVFRFGYDLPSDYGPPLILPSLPGSDFFNPSKNLGWYLFAGIEGRAVAHNIFLDGNTFRDSHSVNKNNFVGSLQGGVAFTFGDARLAYTHVYRTEEFDEQTEPEMYGSFSLSWRF